MEVFKVFPKDRVPQRLPVSRPSFLLVDRRQGLPQGQGSTASAFEQTIAPPARGGPRGFLPGSSSLPRAGLPAQGRHDEWVCVVDSENDGEYFWNRLDNSTCCRLPRGVKHRWCLIPSGLYRDVETQMDHRVLLTL